MLKGYEAIVVMPDNMSEERYDRIQKYGASLDLTPGTESDVILTLERTHSEYVSKPDQYVVLAQFELLPNYRFHRHVTGAAVVEAVKGVGNGRVAAFVSAPGQRRHAGRRRLCQSALSRRQDRGAGAARVPARSTTAARASTASRASATRW